MFSRKPYTIKIRGCGTYKLLELPSGHSGLKIRNLSAHREQEWLDLSVLDDDAWSSLQYVYNYDSGSCA